MGCGEAEQLAGAARLRDLPRECTHVDALGPLLLSLPLLAPALPLPPLWPCCCHWFSWLPWP